MPVELTYRRLGDATGRPLLILHGLFGSAGNWRPLARKLCEQRPVYCLNLRNHGDAPHSPTMTYHEMAEDVLELIDRLELSDADVLGHSMGGKVAMVLSLTQPSRVARLVVVDTAPVSYKSLRIDMLTAMESLDLANVQSRSDADQKMKPYVKNQLLRGFLLTNLARTKDGFVWRVNLEAIGQAISDVAGFPDMSGCAPFAGDTLFLGGARSEYRLNDYEQEIKQFFPSAQTVFVRKAGHWPHADQPEATLSEIQSFLGDDT